MFVSRHDAHRLAVVSSHVVSARAAAFSKPRGEPKHPIVLAEFYLTLRNAGHLLLKTGTQQSLIKLPLKGALPGLLGAMPEQIHLSLGNAWNEMMVTWSTPNTTNTSRVQVRQSNTSHLVTFTGSQSLFIDNGTLHHGQCMHRVILADLAPGLFEYRVGDEAAGIWSEWLQAHASAGGVNWTTPSFTVFGDFGLQNPRAHPQLLQEREAGSSNVIIHTGVLDSICVL